MHGETAYIFITAEDSEVARLLSQRLGVKPRKRATDGSTVFGPVGEDIVTDVELEDLDPDTHDGHSVWLIVYAIEGMTDEESLARQLQDMGAFVREREALTDRAAREIYDWLAEQTDWAMQLISTHDETVASRPGPARTVAV